MDTLKNILKVIGSNITTIIAGVFVSFLLPKIISVADYGFYKTYTLYFNYIGVLSLGLIDGIVLKYGGKEYHELDRGKFRAYYTWYALLQLLFSVIIILVTFFVEGSDYKFVALILTINLLPANTIGYFQQISQIVQRFKEYSLRKIIESVANILIVCVLFLLYKMEWTTVSYKYYLIALVSVSILLFGWYLITYREIVFGKSEGRWVALKDVFCLIKLGFPLLLSNLCSTLMLSLDRQLISMLFSPEEYATYAFAYSMLSLITTATSAVSVVIYPIFKRINEDRLKTIYKDINTLMLVFIFAMMAGYFAICYIIEWFLPQYTYSILIFRIILPGLAVSSSVTIIMHNYYKVFGKTGRFFIQSVISLALSVLCNVVAYWIYGTREAVSMASVIALCIWYVITQLGMRKICNNTWKNITYLALMGTSFYLCGIIPLYWLGFVAYFMVFVVVSLLFYRKDYKGIKAALLK